MGCWVLEGKREKSGPGSGKEGERGIAAIPGLIWGHFEAILGSEVGIWVLERKKERALVGSWKGKGRNQVPEAERKEKGGLRPFWG